MRLVSTALLLLAAACTSGGGARTSAVASTGGEASASGMASGGGMASGSGMASGGSGGAGGAGGAGPALGKPIEAPEKTWTWVEFPDSHCRDGSTTGIGVNWVPGSKKVLVFLEWGGACFSPNSCSQNRSSRGPDIGQNSGIFDRGNQENPFADWNHVYVPYCTGDFHAGNNPSGNVPGVGPQQFVGYTNLDAFLDRLVPTFPDAAEVVLTGSSAGGLGTFYNASHVARRFGNVPIVALDDSGPPMPASVLPACYQKLTRELWSLDKTVLADCGSGCSKQDDYLVDLTTHYSQGKSHSTGILNSYDDGTDITWYNMGGQSCPTPAPALSAAAFEKGLTDLRKAGGGATNRFSTYYVPSTSHVWLTLGGQFYSATVNGTRLVDWTRDLVSGKYSDVGP